MRTARTLYEAADTKMQTDVHATKASMALNREAFTRNVEKYQADREWLIEQARTMTKTFAPYLGFQNVKA